MSQARTEPEQLLREWVDITNEQDYSKIPEVVSESFVWKTPGAPGGEVRGPEGAEEVIDAVTSGFPDFEAEIIDVLTSDDKGMAELRFTMTHEGEFNDIPPTGREAELQAMSTCRVADGKLQELRDYTNMQDLFDQLGVTEE